MCWDVDIVHRPDVELVDADYWSRLGVDLEYDPLYAQYLQQIRQYHTSYPSEKGLPMLPENMPYYRGPKIQSPVRGVTVEAIHVQSLMATITTSASVNTDTLCIRPIQFGSFPDNAVSIRDTSKSMYNSEFASYALQTSQFSWAIYNLSNGHFSSTIESLNFSFNIQLGCDTTLRGRSLFGEFAPKARLFSSGNDFLNYIRSSGDRSVLHGYLINTFQFRTSDITNAFWQLQVQIVAQL